MIQRKIDKVSKLKVKVYDRSEHLLVVNDVVLMCFLLNLNRFKPFYKVSSDNDGKSHDENVYSTDFTTT